MLIKNLAISLIGNILIKGLTFIFILWAAYSLTEKEFVKFSLYYSLYLLKVGIINSGISEILISKKQKENFLDIANQFININIIQIVPIIILVGIIGTFSSVETIQLNIVFFVCICSIISGYTYNLASLYRLNEKHKEAQKIINSVFSGGFVVGILFYLINKSLFMLWIGIFIGQTIGLQYILKIKKIKVKYIKKINAYNTIKKIYPYIIINIFVWFSGYGMNFIIINMLGSGEVEAYTKILTVASILQIVSLALNQVWAPIQVQNNIENNSNEKKSNDIYYISIALLMAIISTLVILTIVNLSDKLKLLESYKYNLTYYSYSTLVYVLFIPVWSTQYQYFINKKSIEFMILTVASGLLGMIGWIISIKYYGELGVYIGIILYNLIRSIVISTNAAIRWKIKSYMTESVIIFSGALILNTILIG